MSDIPPPRPGYRRDPDPEGRWDGYDPDEVRTSVTPERLYQINWGAIVVAAVVAIPLLSMWIPFNILLWRWAI